MTFRCRFSLIEAIYNYSHNDRAPLKSTRTFLNHATQFTYPGRQTPLDLYYITLNANQHLIGDFELNIRDNHHNQQFIKFTYEGCWTYGCLLEWSFQGESPRQSQPWKLALQNPAEGSIAWAIANQAIDPKGRNQPEIKNNRSVW